MDAAFSGLGALTLFVEDLDSSTAFYQDVLGLQAVYQDEDSTVFDVGNTAINLLHASAAPELIDPAPVAPPATLAPACSSPRGWRTWTPSATSSSPEGCSC